MSSDEIPRLDHAAIGMCLITPEGRFDILKAKPIATSSSR